MRCAGQASSRKAARAGRSSYSPLPIGAVVPELTVRSLGGATIEKMTDSGLDGAGRGTLTWKRGQKELDLASQGYIICTPCFEPGVAMFFRHVEGVVENRVDRGITIRRGVGGIRGRV